MAPTTLKIMPLELASQDVNHILHQMDDGADLDQELTAILAEKMGQLSESVDKRIALLDYLGERGTTDKPGTGAIGQIRNIIRIYQEQMLRLELIASKLEEKTIKALDENIGPPFKGSLGSLVVVSNPPSSDLHFESRSKTTVNVVDMETIEFNSIPSEYLIYSEIISINKQKLLEDLKSGKEVPWAFLKRGKRLKINRVPGMQKS